MLIPVAEHNVAHEFSPRLDQDVTSTSDKAPGLAHAGIIKLWKQVSNSSDTLFVFCEDFLQACWLREIGEIRRLHGIALNDANYAAGNESEMIGKLSCRHGFFVRLPGQLVFRKALQKSARDWRLSLKLREQRLCDRHGDSPLLNCPKTKILLNGSRFRAARLGALAHVLMNVGPALDDAGPVLLCDQAEAGVPELDHRDAILLA